MEKEDLTLVHFETISSLLQTGLGKNELEPILNLLRNGVHPDAISVLILELRREVARMNNVQR